MVLNEQNHKPSLKPNQRIASRMNSDLIYNYTAKIESTKRRFEKEMKRRMVETVRAILSEYFTDKR